MDKLIAGLVAFAALCTLFDLLSRGHNVVQNDAKVPRDLVFAQVVLLLSVVLGTCMVLNLLPYPMVELLISTGLAGYGIYLRRKLSLPQTQQAVVVPAAVNGTATGK